MSEPLAVEYLELIKERWARWAAAGLPVSKDRQDLMAEVERLRAELARRDEQIAAVRALHVPFDAEHRIRGTVQCCEHCSHLIGDYEHWPCATVRALVDGGAS